MTTVLEPRTLSAALREGTAAAHEDAETSGFVQNLTAGRLPREAYAALAAQNLAIYTALEQVTAALRDHPLIAPFAIEALVRVPALQEDLAALGVTRPAALVTSATNMYACHLRRLASWPAGILAHNYVRYLGDLSGGQIVRRRMRDVYGEFVPTRFYDFDGIPKVKPFKDRYRALLDEAPLEDGEQPRVVREAVHAFRLNEAVFADLDRVFPL